jgi:hypothetical protein
MKPIHLNPKGDKIRIGILLPLIPILLMVYCGQKEELPVYKNTNLPVEKRVEDLLTRMTLEEKIDQLSGVGFDTKEGG